MKGIKDIGVDIVEVERFSSLAGAARKLFLERTFTPLERVYCDKRSDRWHAYAGTFAGKEAVFKALGKGHFLEYEIRRDMNGKPEVWQKGKRMKSVLISISHTKDSALAVAVKI